MPDADDQPTWTWDPSLYAGSAGYYAAGRVDYPPTLVTALVEDLSLDGTGRLLDVGCGPGSITLLLAPYVAQAVGVDADAEMLAEAARLARQRGVTNVRWRHLRAEQLPADLAPVRLVTLAQSFHWMDRPRVATVLRGLLEPGGALVHVSATTHEGANPDDDAPPWRAVDDLIAEYLGPRRRAGQGVRPPGPNDENEIYAAAGFDGPRPIIVPAWPVERGIDQIVASVHSLSYAAPHLFGGRLDAFDQDLRALLRNSTSTGVFRETMPPIRLDIWR
jgi:SAM-dependent methyltransferase